jgi:nicotinamidase/pyrazinamidase
MSSALIVVDMLNDFIDEKGTLFCGSRARKTIPYIRSLIDRYRRDGGIIIYVCDSHSKDDREFSRFSSHCVKGTWGAEVVAGLEPVVPGSGGGDFVVRKTRYSAFYKTDLEDILKDNAVKEAGVVGVCTSICVMDTVGGLANRDYEIRVYERGVADLDRKMERFSLERMHRIYGAEIISS